MHARGRLFPRLRRKQNQDARWREPAGVQPVSGKRVTDERPSRKKKAPGKFVSQGGEGQQTFPGAIGRRRAATAGLVALAGAEVCPKRATCVHAGGKTLRGPQKPAVWPTPRCRPIHVDCLSYPTRRGWLSCFFLSVRLSSRLSVRSRGGEDREFAFSRQGRFLRGRE